MGSSSELGTCANIFRVLFVIFNILFIILGIIGFSIGVWQVVAADGSYDFITGSDTVSGAAISIVVNIFVIAIGAVGVLGALFKWRPLLLIYAIVWTILILLGIIGAIISFYYSDNVSAAAEESYRDGWTRAINDYNMTEGATDSVDAFQKTFECCGIDNSSNWVDLRPDYFRNNSFRLPPSCQCSTGENCQSFNIQFQGVDYPQTAYNRGCYQVTVDFFQAYSFISGVVAIIFAIIETFGVFVAIGLICCITSARKKEIV
ncbi:PREDICTED: tetraspanin-4-like [Amphimedon queenslandica]|uniref:Tetraspanin n=1 Tax=Amphimedon queenslandica TaxID=400682 RepID=A0A1X7UM51_AMPQE|nr:PREDICTED: tetraspanin-4-like [Amphimedon queenslandica]|eukprot:XP_011404719.1 PREDICTED: tetraspanin-4-like [Amphimedon queenslandica]